MSRRAGMWASRPAVFLDKDGTLIKNVPYNVDPARIELTADAAAGLRRLTSMGFELVVATNQTGVALGYFDETALRAVYHRLQHILQAHDVRLLDFRACPHAPASDARDGCLCRKPRPGMLLRAAAEHGLDLSRSWMIGDSLDDVEAGRRAGCQAIFFDVGLETEWRLTPIRTPELRATTLLQAAELIELHGRP